MTFITVVTFEQLNTLSPTDNLDPHYLANRTLRKDSFYVPGTEVDDRFELIKELRMKFNIVPSKDDFEKLKNETMQNSEDLDFKRIEVNKKIIEYLQDLYV